MSTILSFIGGAAFTMVIWGWGFFIGLVFIRWHMKREYLKDKEYFLKLHFVMQREVEKDQLKKEINEITK